MSDDDRAQVAARRKRLLADLAAVIAQQDAYRRGVAPCGWYDGQRVLTWRVAVKRRRQLIEAELADLNRRLKATNTEG